MTYGRLLHAAYTANTGVPPMEVPGLTDPPLVPPPEAIVHSDCQGHLLSTLPADPWHEFSPLEPQCH